jgi:multidrug resistance efflux pump
MNHSFLLNHWKRRGHSVSVWVPLVLLGATGLGAGWALRARDHAATPADSGGAAPAREQPVVACLGVVDFDAGVLSLQPTVPGRVLDVLVAENQHVKAGAVLLRLDDEPARGRVGEAEAALEAAEAQVAEARQAPQQHRLLLEQQRSAIAAAQHDLAAARLTAARKRELAKLELIDHKDADAADEEVKKLEALGHAALAKLEALGLRDPEQEVRRAEAEARAKRQALGQARHFLGEHTLRAPSDGTILRVSTSPGEVISLQAREPALTFAPGKPRIVRAEVGQEFAERVAVDQRAEIEDDANLAGPKWQGRVTRVADWFTQRRTVFPDAPSLQDVRMLQCVIEIESGDRPLRIGQRVRVELFR